MKPNYEEKKCIASLYRQDHTTKSTSYEIVNFQNFIINRGNGFSLQDGQIVCNKDMLISIEGSYYWINISGKRVNYGIVKNGTRVETFNKFCDAGGYYEVSIDKTILQVNKGDIISLQVRTEEGAGGTAGSRGRFIIQEL